MAFDGRDLIQRRPVGTAPSITARKAPRRAYSRRKILASRSDRKTLIAIIFAVAAIFTSFGYLMSHLRRIGGADKDATSGDQDRILKEWKPQSIGTVRRDKGINAADKALKAAIVDKESGRRTITDNNDERKSSIRREKTENTASSETPSLYRPKFDESVLGYDIYNCPATPPDSYPKSWKATEILKNWNPNDVTTLPPQHREIYQGLCIFDYQTQYDIAKTYRDAEKPFVVRNDPDVMAASKRWKDNNYLLKHLPIEKVYTERSPINHFMFYNAQNEKNVKHWKRPANDAIEMTYREWLERALEREATALDSSEISSWVEELREKRITSGQDGLRDASPSDDDDVTEDNDGEEEKRLKWYYLQINGWLEDAEDGVDKFVFDELPFFDPRKEEESDLYFVDQKAQKGLNCRFGMRGIIAENHFDLSRNMLALLEGE